MRAGAAVISAPSRWRSRTPLRTPETQLQTACADDRGKSSARLERQLQNFAHANLSPLRDGLFDAARQLAAVHPSSVAALIHDGECPARRVAAQPKVFAR